MDSMMDVSEVSSSNALVQEAVDVAPINRVSTHSHLKGLGIDSVTHEPTDTSGGFIGQQSARYAASVVCDLIKEKRFAGKAVLLAGPSGTGKTAVAYAMTLELGNHIPFNSMSASEVYSTEIKRTECLMENFRKSISIQLKERKKVYEGEITMITPVEMETPVHSFGKSISHVNITLKTTKAQKTLKLDASIYDQILKIKASVGDVVYIEANSGNIKRLGRCDLYSGQFDLEAEEYVPLPNGDVLKEKDVVQYVTLHDLDMANAKPQGKSGDMMNLLKQIVKPKATEITDRLREEVDKTVDQYVRDGIAEVIPGVLFIDEAHMLDTECCSFLHRVLESNKCPVVVLATNRGRVKMDNPDDPGFHGLPRDLLDRLIIISTELNTPDEVYNIVKVRAIVEGVQLDESALAEIASISVNSSLRYVLGLITPGQILAEVAGRSTVLGEDIKQASTLFIDYKMCKQKYVTDTAAAAAKTRN
uniref:RuvB-like helicase n=1 Tax=Rhabditophanes sp. KR3021 TaxID=114890 RepID=A0AC35TG71_9BILA